MFLRVGRATLHHYSANEDLASIKLNSSETPIHTNESGRAILRVIK